MSKVLGALDEAEIVHNIIRLDNESIYNESRSAAQIGALFVLLTLGVLS